MRVSKRMIFSYPRAVGPLGASPRPVIRRGREGIRAPGVWPAGYGFPNLRNVWFIRLFSRISSPSQVPAGPRGNQSETVARCWRGGMMHIKTNNRPRPVVYGCDLRQRSPVHYALNMTIILKQFDEALFFRYRVGEWMTGIEVLVWGRLC
jgi:hypothetical protein